MPYRWDLNIYRGCQHGCKYCYAVYSHKYLDSVDFFTDIHIKTNIVDELEKELRNNSWKREVVNIGGITDSYQPVEDKYKLMPEILKLFILDGSKAPIGELPPELPDRTATMFPFEPTLMALFFPDCACM